MANLIRIACFFAMTAVYLSIGAKPFFAWWSSHAEFHMWAAALESISPAFVNAMALGAVPFAVLLFLSMSLAIFSLIGVIVLAEATGLMARDLAYAGSRIRAWKRAKASPSN
jgi:hypothetical protein